jgi:serine/threonine protein kinase
VLIIIVKLFLCYVNKGSFGVVYEVKNKETQEKFALKIINKEKVSKLSTIKIDKN